MEKKGAIPNARVDVGQGHAKPSTSLQLTGRGVYPFSEPDIKTLWNDPKLSSSEKPLSPVKPESQYQDKGTQTDTHIYQGGRSFHRRRSKLRPPFLYVVKPETECQETQDAFAVSVAIRRRLAHERNKIRDEKGLPRMYERRKVFKARKEREHMKTGWSEQQAEDEDSDGTLQAD